MYGLPKQSIHRLGPQTNLKPTNKNRIWAKDIEFVLEHVSARGTLQGT